MKRRFIASSVMVGVAVLHLSAAGQTARPVGPIERVAVISVDGMRPDVLLRAQAPNMRKLMANGSFTFWARSTEVSVTLPSHVSMLTGVPPEKHGITFNTDPPLDKEVYPACPTIFELAKKAGYSTALISGKSKFSVLAKPGTVDWAYIPARGKAAGDPDIARAAAAIVAEHRPQLLFVHFASNDAVGHSKGWGSAEQIAGMEGADEAVGVVLDAIEKAGLTDSTLILLTADHGGAGKSHGRDDPRSRHIPWIAAGPGVVRNFDLTQYPALTVNIEDTFATACYFLGIEPGNVDGKPVLQIRKTEELPVKKAA
jgi:predicted AlkP superfamily pyrophosphatase or phosphodiesterase